MEVSTPTADSMSFETWAFAVRILATSKPRPPKSPEVLQGRTQTPSPKYPQSRWQRTRRNVPSTHHGSWVLGLALSSVPAQTVAASVLLRGWLGSRATPRRLWGILPSRIQHIQPSKAIKLAQPGTRSCTRTQGWLPAAGSTSAALVRRVEAYGQSVGGCLALVTGSFR